MLDVEILTPNIGADIRGIDLNDMKDELFDAIYDAWLEHLVIRFRGQHLDDVSLQAFSARFGPLEEIPLGLMPESERRKVSNRYVTVISNIRKNGTRIGGLANLDASWHSDMTYNERPPPASVLYAIEVPDEGGDTWFASQYGAYDELPAALKRQIVELELKHDAAHNSIGELRHGYEPPASPFEAPGAVHPIVSTHPETHRKCLYLGRRAWASIPAMDPDESERLVDELWHYAALDNNVFRQTWQVGDVVVWDNRCVLHRRDGFDDNKRRLMRRCQILDRTTLDPN